MLALLGIGRDPFTLTPEERVLDAYYERLTAYAVDKSRVIVIEFQSRDPDLAARVANSIAEGYLVLQQGARQEQAQSAGQWLAGEIESLRKKVAEAEARVEDFRSKSSLFVGTNNTTLSNQQMGEINTQLNNARAQKSDAESKARLIRGMLQSGKPIEASEVLNSELVRRLGEQRVDAARAAGRAILDAARRPSAHQGTAGADRPTSTGRFARKPARFPARSKMMPRIAGARAESMSASLEQLKKQAASTNGQDVQLRALEREAKAQRDLLESYLAKFREATTRENIEAAPADGRIISRAIVSNIPAYPKKLPIVLIATLATLMLAPARSSPANVAHDRAARGRRPRRRDQRRAAVAHAGRRAGARAGGRAARRCCSEPQSRHASPALTEIGAIAAIAHGRRRGAQGHDARHRCDEGITLTALTLARLIARHARVVAGRLVGVVADAVGGVGRSGGAGPDRIDAGRGVVRADHRQGPDVARASRQRRASGRRMRAAAIAAADAGDRCLLRVYDHVLLDAGTASDLPAELLTAQARAVVVPDARWRRMPAPLMCDQLRAVGFPRGDDAEPQPMPSRRSGRAGVRGWWRPERAAG